MKLVYASWALVRRELRVRYGSTMLGLGWAILHPFLFLALYTVVFSVIFQVRFQPTDTTTSSALHVVLGLLPYIAINEALSQAATCLSANRGLIDKSPLDPIVLPLVGVVSATVTEVAGLVLVIVVRASAGHLPPSEIVWLPLCVLLRMVLVAGLAQVVSVLNVLVRDFGQVLGLLLTSWMFLTPIFYPESMLPGWMRSVQAMNPLHLVVESYRAAILVGKPLGADLLSLIPLAIGAVVAGTWFFRRSLRLVKDRL